MGREIKVLILRNYLGAKWVKVKSKNLLTEINYYEALGAIQVLDFYPNPNILLFQSEEIPV